MYILVLLLPLLLGIVPIINGIWLGRKALDNLVIFVLGTQLICTWYLFYEVIIQNSFCTLYIFQWLHLDYFSLDGSFVFDVVSVSMLILVNTVAFLVHLYSLSYMNTDPNKIKFMGFISFFTFFMNLLVLSDNLVQLFIGWEGVGLMSYLLINFWNTRIQANKSGIKAMLVNKIGDVCFLFSIVIILYVFGTINIYELSLLVNSVFIENTIINYLGVSSNLVFFISLFLFLAAVGKSAQLGLHTWLPDAMEGPTPVSALIHAATMVTAGIFLVIRTHYFFDAIPSLALVIVIVGSLTALFSASVALIQTDIKKIIAYSTCSQLGLMLVACGFHQYYLGLFHMINHGFFKALLFLSAGGIIHDCYSQQDTDEHIGSWIMSPFTHMVSFIASLSLIGVYFGSGFYSKELIISLSSTTFTIQGEYISIILGLATCLTTIYSWQIISDIINSNINTKTTDASKDFIFSIHIKNKNNSFITVWTSIYYSLHKLPWTLTNIKRISLNLLKQLGNTKDILYMNFVYYILVVFSILSGYLLLEVYFGFGYSVVHSTLDTFPFYFLLFDIENIEFSDQLLTCSYAIIGWLSAILFFKNEKNIWTISTFYKTNIQFGKSYLFLANKWYFDIIINRFILGSIWYFNYSVMLKIVDYTVTEYIESIYLVYIFKTYSDLFKKIQSITFKSNFYLFFICILSYISYFIFI